MRPASPARTAAGIGRAVPRWSRPEVAIPAPQIIPWADNRPVSRSSATRCRPGRARPTCCPGARSAGCAVRGEQPHRGVLGVLLPPDRDGLAAGRDDAVARADERVRRHRGAALRTEPGVRVVGRDRHDVDRRQPGAAAGGRGRRCPPSAATCRCRRPTSTTGSTPTRAGTRAFAAGVPATTAAARSALRANVNCSAGGAWWSASACPQNVSGVPYTLCGAARSRVRYMPGAPASWLIIWTPLAATRSRMPGWPPENARSPCIGARITRVHRAGPSGWGRPRAGTCEWKTAMNRDTSNSTMVSQTTSAWSSPVCGRATAVFSIFTDSDGRAAGSPATPVSGHTGGTSGTGAARLVGRDRRRLRDRPGRLLGAAASCSRATASASASEHRGERPAPRVVSSSVIVVPCRSRAPPQAATSGLPASGSPGRLS